MANDPTILIERTNQITKITPEEIYIYILQKIKNDIEVKLSQKVDKAVISVPAHFNQTQRNATLEAAKKSGFQVLQLFNEPTAAALAYYFENQEASDGYSLVYDLGGGTFDVSVLKRLTLNHAHLAIDIIGVDGDSHLGGRDFDNLLVDHVCDVLLQKYKYNPRTDRRAMRRLRNECEELKKDLSFSEQSTLVLTGFIKKVYTIEISVTRQQFEVMSCQWFKRTIDIVENCLKSVKLTKSDIKDVILAGGSTRIPKIQQMLSEFFDGKVLTEFINPDECVAEGSALQAAMLSVAPSQNIDHIKITDVIPLSLGVGDWMNVTEFLIKRNSQIPVYASTWGITSYNQQTEMLFEIFEGERVDSRKNHSLGVLEIKDLTPAPPGQCYVELIISVDKNGILELRATETLSKKTKDLKIAYTRGVRSESEVVKVVQDAQENEEYDETFNDFALKKDELLTFCVNAKYNFENLGLIGEYQEAYDLCDRIENVAEMFDLGDESQMIKLKKELLAKVQPLIKKHNFSYISCFKNQ